MGKKHKPEEIIGKPLIAFAGQLLLGAPVYST